MTLTQSNEQNIIERDIYCPFCQNEKALLISELSEKSSALQWPNYGLKYWLCVIFTGWIYALIRGFKFVEKERTYKYTTYGFCPCCGKSFNAGIPAAVENAVKSESKKLYKSVYQKKVAGVCGGIAEYTGLSLKLVRLNMVLSSVMTAGLFAVGYLILAWILEKNPEQ